MKKSFKFFSANNLEKYDTLINIVLIVLSLMLLGPIIQFLLDREDFRTVPRRSRPPPPPKPPKPTKAASFRKPKVVFTKQQIEAQKKYTF